MIIKGQNMWGMIEKQLLSVLVSVITFMEQINNQGCGP